MIIIKMNNIIINRPLNKSKVPYFNILLFSILNTLKSNDHSVIAGDLNIFFLV